MQLPEDIWKFSIIPYCGLDFLCVNKSWRAIAKQHIIADSRMRTVIDAAMVYAAERGDLNFIKLLRTHPNANPSCFYESPLRLAALNGHMDVVKYLVEECKADVTVERTEIRKKKNKIVHGWCAGKGRDGSSLLAIAIDTHNCALLDYFFNRDQIRSDPEFYAEQGLTHAIKGDNVAMMRYFLDDRAKFQLDLSDGYPLVTAVVGEHQQAVDLLLTCPEIGLKRAFLEAISENVPKMKLLADPRLVVTEDLLMRLMSNCSLDEFTCALQKSGLQPSPHMLALALRSNARLVDYMLANVRLEDVPKSGVLGPLINNGDLELVQRMNALSIEASREEINDGLKMTLSYNRVPMARYLVEKGAVITQGYFKGIVDSTMQDMFLMLLQSAADIDLSFEDNYLIRTAADNGCDRIVEKLLTRPEINPAAQDNMALRLAVLKSGTVDPARTRIVKMLLADSRVDPTANHNHAIQVAALSSNIEIVKLLLADPRIDPSANKNYAYTQAQKRNVEIAKLIAADPRFKK